MPSKRFDIHPDLKAGEPIPEIEPRIDTLRLEIVERLNRWWIICVMIVLVTTVVSVFLKPSLLTRVGFFTVMIVLWMFPYFKKKNRALIAQQREFNRTALGAGKYPQHDHWNIPFRNNAMHFVLTMGLMITAPMMMLAGESYSGMFINLGMYMVMGGLAMIFTGTIARQPGQICCKECSYPLTGLTIPCFCPECGRSIIDEGLTTDRPRIRSPWFVRIGIATVLIAALLLYASTSKPTFLYTSMPRGALLRLATTDDDAFDRYLAAYQSQTDTDRLIERLIESRIFDEGAYQSYTQKGWLGELLSTGALSKGQMDRLFEPYLDLRIHTSRPVEVGNPVTLWISNQRPFEGVNSVDPIVFFGGYVIGDNPAPISRSLDTIQLEDILSVDDGTPATRRPISRTPEWTFTPDQLGEVVITARVVVGIFPRRAMVSIDWESDELFDTQAIWTVNADVTRTLTIDP